MLLHPVAEDFKTTAEAGCFDDCPATVENMKFQKTLSARTFTGLKKPQLGKDHAE